MTELANVVKELHETRNRLTESFQEQNRAVAAAGDGWSAVEDSFAEKHAPIQDREIALIGTIAKMPAASMNELVMKLAACSYFHNPGQISDPDIPENAALLSAFHDARRIAAEGTPELASLFYAAYQPGGNDVWRVA
jgi:hypothetical protein